MTVSYVARHGHEKTDIVTQHGKLATHVHRCAHRLQHAPRRELYPGAVECERTSPRCERLPARHLREHGRLIELATRRPAGPSLPLSRKHGHRRLIVNMNTWRAAYGAPSDDAVRAFCGLLATSMYAP